MLKTLALTGCLGLALAAPLAAETYTDPDRAWCCLLYTSPSPRD